MFGADGVPQFCGPRCEEAYRALFNIESYLRFMVRWELVGKYAEQWEQMLGEAVEEAAGRREEERRIRKIDAEETILSYLTLSELKDVIFDEKVWLLFKDHFPPRDMCLADFKLLIAVRNKNAHFRPMTDRDLAIVRRCLEDMVGYTRGYSQQRAEERLLDAAKLFAPFETQVTPWAASIADGASVWSSIQVRALGQYVRVDLALKEGLLPADVVRSLVRKAKVDCVFAGLDAASGRLTLYIPKSIGEPQLGRLVEAAKAIEPLTDTVATEPGPEATRLDYVFAHDVRLPAPFRLST